MYVSSNSHRWNSDSWIFLLFVYGGNNLLDSVYKHVVWAISFSVDLLSLCKQWRYCVPCGADLMSLYKLCCFMGQRWNARKWLDRECDCQFCCSAISEFCPTFTRPQGREAPTNPPNYQMSHKLDYLYRLVIYLAWECNGYIAAHLTLQCPLTDIPYIEVHTNSSHHSGTTASVPMPKWH